jgi:predicted HTH transcriptional regulator
MYKKRGLTDFGRDQPLTHLVVMELARESGFASKMYEKPLQEFAKLIITIANPRQITKTQKIYLQAIAQPKTLQDLAKQFGCTTEGARKHLKALIQRGLADKEIRFQKRSGRDKGAWAFHYIAKEKR